MRDERGFRVYAEFEDTYGANVTVKQSSADPLDKLRIFVKGGGTSGERRTNDGAAHLDIKQATRVRDAINKWLEDQAKMGPVENM